MPAMVTLAANPMFVPKNEDEAAHFSAAKKQGKMLLDWTTAIENVRNSGGMYRIVPEPEPGKAAIPTLEDMTVSQLRDAAIMQGIKIEKQMKRADLIRLLRSRQAEILDDDEDEDVSGEQ